MQPQSLSVCMRAWFSQSEGGRYAAQQAAAAGGRQQLSTPGRRRLLSCCFPKSLGLHQMFLLCTCYACRVTGCSVRRADRRAVKGRPCRGRRAVAPHGTQRGVLGLFGADAVALSCARLSSTTTWRAFCSGRQRRRRVRLGPAPPRTLWTRPSWRWTYVDRQTAWSSSCDTSR